MIADLAGDALDIAKSLYRAFQGRLDLVFKGESRVSSSCQIPDIRDLYRELGLPVAGGMFVEIGAFDGDSYSNTSFLADQGWRGVYIEPIPKFYRRMRMRHIFNNVTGACVGIAGETDTARISVMGPFSTMNEAAEKQYKLLNWSQRMAGDSRSITIRTERLETVLTRHAVPDQFDLMIIDVEGAEEGIVQSLLGSTWRPRVLIIELCDVHPDFADNDRLTGSHRRVRESLIADGYRERFVDPINTVLVRGGARV